MRRILSLSLILCIAAIGCSSDINKSVSTTEGGLVKVRLALNWFPEAEHGGFYAAKEHGFYEDAGLAVEIVPGGPNAPVIQEVITGRVEFGVTNADQIFLGRAQDAKVTALMAPLQNGPRCIMVHEKSGIEKFEDLNNMTIALSEAKPFALYMMQKLPLDNVEFVPYPGSVAEFMINDKFAQQAYVFSEPFVAAQKGGDPKVLMLSDFGFNLYSSIVFADERLIKERPKIVEAMVKASIKGWKKYLESPEETNKAIHQANPEMGLDILEFGTKAMQPLCETDGDAGFGSMTKERWQTLHDQMLEIGSIEKAIPINDVFTTQFLR